MVADGPALWKLCWIRILSGNIFFPLQNKFGCVCPKDLVACTLNSVKQTVSLVDSREKHGFDLLVVPRSANPTEK